MGCMVLNKKKAPSVFDNTILPERRTNMLAKRTSNPADHYLIKEKLGSGGFSSVYKVVCKATGLVRAMKIIKLSALDEDNAFLKEIKVLAKISHPNIVKVFEYFVDSENCFIISEFIKGGELCDSVVSSSDFSESKAASVMNQLLSAVFYLHSLRIVHRDLKLENILVEKNNSKEIQIKLIDFGICSYLPEGKYLSQKVGTAYYVAPEVLKEKYTETCDVWSCGVILFVLLMGYPPFSGENTAEIFKNIKQAKFSFEDEEWNFVSDEAKELVKSMLTKKQSSRPSVESCLNSKWLKNNQKAELNQQKLKSVLKNMKKFNAKTNLKKSAISYIVHFFKSSVETEDLRQIFVSMDNNKDGKLTLKELKQGFKEINEDLSEIEFSDLIRKVGGNADEAIEYEEFLKVSSDETQVLNSRKLKLAFEQFDTNGDGNLNVSELKTALFNSENAFIREIISKLKQKKMKAISFKVFVELVTDSVTNSILKWKTMSPNREMRLSNAKSKELEKIFTVKYSNSKENSFSPNTNQSEINLPIVDQNHIVTDNS